MKPYPKYKDSGIEWIGTMPENWDLTKLKYETRFINGCAFKPAEWSDEGTPIIRIENLNGGEEFNCYEGEVEERYHVFKGDLLFAWSGNVGTSFGSFLWQKEGRFYLNQHIFKLANYRLHKKFFYWLLKAVTVYVESKTHGIIGLVHVTKDEIGGVEIPIPKTEQESIASFLDDKTRQIDSLIEKKQKQIELLLEERTAIINEAVTKGLNPNAKTKDSGIEWIGKIPDTWEMKRTKHLLRRVKGAIKTGPFGSQLKSSDITDSGIKVYNQRSVLDNDFEQGEGYISEDKFKELQGFEIFADDFLITTRGTIGRGAIFPKNGEKGVLHPCLMRLQLDQQLILNEYFLLFVQNSAVFKENVLYESNATTIEVIYTDTMKEVAIPLPSIDEQHEIVSMMQEWMRGVQSSLDAIEKQIALLQEYRQSLISEVVTGKIDVREIA